MAYGSERCITYYYYLLLIIQSSFPYTMAGPTLSRLPKIHYSTQGHLKVAMLTNLLGWDDVMCSNVIDSINDMQYIVASLMGAEKVNTDPTLLGNITLGLEFMEECDKAVAAIGQGFKMAPNTSFLSELGYARTQREEVGIVAAIGTATSGSTVPLASVLNLFDMTLVSPGATTDELRDRVKYPNFYRLVPSDSFQTKVIIQLIAEFGWNYFSIIHSETSYGYNGVKFLRYHAKRMGICVADTYPLADDFVEEDYVRLMRIIYPYSLSITHVVVIFSYSFQMRSIVEVSHAHNMSNFIFVLSEYGDAGTLAGLGDTTLGSFIVDWHIATSEEFKERVTKHNAIGHQSNAFYQLVWRQFAGCNISDLPNDDPCLYKVLEDFTDFWFYTSSKLYMEAVEVIGSAIHDLILADCPSELDTPTENLLDCVKPERLIPFVKNTTLLTDEGPKFFDEVGEMEINFRIRQMQAGIEHVGTWEHQSHQFEWFRELRWHVGMLDPPEAVCSRPCKPGEFYIQGELPCCWECHRCRDNEYVTNNATTCLTCPPLTWPDQVTFDTCVDVEPAFMEWSDVYGIGLTCLAGLGLVVTLTATIVMIKHRERRVVKGAVLSMMSIILSGQYLAFSTVLLLIAKPNDIMCYLNRVAFIFSCTLIYVPLLYKTLRVYLVFAASSKLKPVSPLAKISSQYALVSLTFILQGALLVVSNLYWPIRALKTMPVPTLRYVELSCHQDQKGLLIPLSFNLLLILLSSVLAFLTRKLPDNFNESWYIFLSVSTTLFVWIAFLPTYYAAFYAYHKAALLGLALTLNGVVTLLCLFAPKVYALIYVAEMDIKITDFDQKSFEMKTQMTTTTETK